MKSPRQKAFKTENGYFRFSSEVQEQMLLTFNFNNAPWAYLNSK